jgi:TM2 domain-containing membrane protein YozV
LQMKFSFKYYIIIPVIFPEIIFPQTPLAAQFNYAHELFNEEKYFDAVTEFKRLLFFDKDGIYKYEADLLIGSSYKMGGKYSEALQYFTLAEFSGRTPEERYAAKIENIRTNILARRISRALRLIDELTADKQFADKKDELNYWRGWAYIFNDEWDKASEFFGDISPGHELKELADKIEDQKYSVAFAKISSFIIPGAGQFYTGNYISGLISLGWNVLLGYITINSFIEGRYFDAVIVGNFLWLRFYSGNIQNAEKFAVKKNLEISNAALEYLQNQYNGKKP